MKIRISRCGRFYSRIPQNPSKYSLLPVSLCRSPRCSEHTSQSVEERLIFRQAFQHWCYSTGTVEIFCFSAWKPWKWINGSVQSLIRLFRPSFPSLKPELREVMFLKDSFCGKRVVLTSGYRCISNSTTSSISCPDWKSRMYKFIF